MRVLPPLEVRSTQSIQVDSFAEVHKLVVLATGATPGAVQYQRPELGRLSDPELNRRTREITRRISLTGTGQD